MQKLRMLGAYVFAAVAVLAFHACRPEAPPAKAVPEFERDFDAFVAEVDATHPFFDLKGIRADWEVAKHDLRARLPEARSQKEFLGIVIDAIQCLRDSKMWIVNSKAMLPPPPLRFNPGISFMETAQGAFVVMRSPKNLSDALPVGTEVLAIDGQDAGAYLREEMAQAWAERFCSSPQRARMLALRVPMRGAQGDAHVLTVRLPDGETAEVEAPSIWRAGDWPRGYNLPDDLEKCQGEVFHTQFPSGVGYVFIRQLEERSPTYNTPLFLEEARQAHPSAQGWIVDLRGCGGGPYDATVLEAAVALGRPMSVLIGPGCTEEGELLARDLRSKNQAFLMGSVSGGAASESRVWTFPSGLAGVRMSVKSHLREDGQPIEFKGIAPDHELRPLLEDVQNGRNTGIANAEKDILSVGVSH